MSIPEQLEQQKGAMTLMALAVLLGVSYKTTYRWAKYDGLPASRIGGTYWVDPHETARWWREHSIATSKPPVKGRTAREANRVA